jgi:serine phosphatase RsbU (regulator of sigma subunit)
MVHEATAEVVLQKERIEKKHAEISLNHSELIEKNVLIEHQKTELEETNKDILDSIRYAQKIQFAILPDADTMHEMFAQHFVLNLPRDIIGGDFFWARQLRSTNYDLSVVAVADCTGHGVPGALMSMLGFAFLNEIVLRQKVFQAAQVLDMLREKVMTALRRNDERRSAGDGMDIALCIIDRRCHTLSFAGANRPLYLIRDGEINAISGNNFAIGKMTGISKRFTQTDISLRQNDSIYLFSDGFADQFGGDDGRKFMRKGLKNTLSQIQHQPMAQQGASLQSVHDNWRGPFRQVDDILVVGIKYDITEKHT